MKNLIKLYRSLHKDLTASRKELSILNLICLSIIFLSSSTWGWHWIDLWKTADQQGYQLLHTGQAHLAAQKFKNKSWQGIAHYRAGNYQSALQQFNTEKTSNGYYNAGNAAAFLGEYQTAIHAYNKALALNAKNTDAAINREIIKKLLREQQQKNNRGKDHSSPQDKQSTKLKPATDNIKPSSDQAFKNANQNSPAKQASAPNQQTQPFSNQPPSTPKNKKITSSQTQNQNAQINNKNNDNHLETKNSNSISPSQSDEQQQLLRRIVDYPEGLLRQKFLRDYIHHHGNELSQGEN